MISCCLLRRPSLSSDEDNDDLSLDIPTSMPHALSISSWFEDATTVLEQKRFTQETSASTIGDAFTVAVLTKPHPRVKIQSLRC